MEKKIRKLERQLNWCLLSIHLIKQKLKTSFSEPTSLEELTLEQLREIKSRGSLTKEERKLLSKLITKRLGEGV